MASHRRHVRHFSRDYNARKSLLQGLMVSLIEHGRIRTTLVKAQETRRGIEKLVTLAKSPSVARYRLLLRKLRGNQSAVARLTKEIAPKYQSRSGGYTRITKLGPRVGDRAEMAVLEFV